MHIKVTVLRVTEMTIYSPQRSYGKATCRRLWVNMLLWVDFRINVATPSYITPFVEMQVDSVSFLKNNRQSKVTPATKHLNLLRISVTISSLSGRRSVNLSHDEISWAYNLKKRGVHANTITEKASCHRFQS